jgi:uncharacterized membrane protein
MGIGTILRFSRLTTKPPWTDEFATMVFSLGNHFRDVPIDRLISPETLLQPLRFNPDANIAHVVSLLLSEDNHPPLYFVLAHLWQNFWGAGEGYIDLGIARSLSALLGVMAIPAMYALGRIAFKSRFIGQGAAVMMAVSPYGIFLAQDARHYTLAILFVIASLACMVRSLSFLIQRDPIPPSWITGWILANSLGFSTHYFFGITLLAEGIVSIGFLGWQWRMEPLQFRGKPWRSLLWVGMGTGAAIAVLLNLSFSQGYGKNMTSWLQIFYTFLSLISPVFQLLGTWITMVALLPVESSNLFVVTASGLLMLLFFIWFMPIALWSLQRSYRDRPLPTLAISGFILSAIAVFLVITYIVGKDITKGARYSFTYFPAIILLLGAILATCWQSLTPRTASLPARTFLSRLLSPRWHKDGKWIAGAIVTMGLASSLTVIANLGYQKYYTADRLLPIIAKNSSVPVLIATTHQSLVQVGEMMGIAWELQKTPLPVPISFLLANQDRFDDPKSTQTLEQEVAQLPRPLDVWAVNFYAPIDLASCSRNKTQFPYINGYGYQLYHCQ